MRPLGTYQDVATLMNVNKDTIYKWVYLDRFQKGCFIPDLKRFNMDRIERLLSNGGVFKKSAPTSNRIVMTDNSSVEIHIYEGSPFTVI